MIDYQQRSAYPDASPEHAAINARAKYGNNTN